MFKPRVHECTITEDDESFTFYVREPGGSEILDEVDAAKKAPDKPSKQTTREQLAKYIVNKDGSAVSKEQVDEIMGARASALALINAEVAEKMGLKRMLEPKKA